MSYLFAYIATILATNIGFAYIPPIDLGFGLFSPMAICAGAVFVARDFAQRAVGHWVFPAMLLGCVISYVMADPFVALASMLSFAVSEFTDWAVYTKTKRPFHKRVLISSAIATPIDTFIFLTMIGILSEVTFVLMVASKILTSIGVWYYGEKQSRAKNAAPNPVS